VENIITACPILAREEYIKRHDRVCAELQFNICKEKGVTLDSEHWYTHVPNQLKQVMNIRLPNYRTTSANRQNYS